MAMIGPIGATLLNMKKNIIDMIKANTRCLTPRVRLGGMVVLGLMLFYGGVFYAMKTFGANRAYAFGRPSIIEMDAAAKRDYSDDLEKLLIKDPEKISMLLGQDLTLILAQPDLVRKDAMMSMWQFRSTDCVLDVYFKPASDDWKYAPVMHYEMRKRQKAVFRYDASIEAEAASPLEDAQSCVKSLIEEAAFSPVVPRSQGHVESL